jgi:glycosyltransferase involved in cell wall biosynthesis
MKVLHVIPSLGPKLGGPSEAVIKFVYYLNQYGIDAEIATTNYNQEDNLDVPLFQRYIYQDVPVYFFPYRALSSLSKEFLPSLSLTRWLMDNLVNYDLLHTNYIYVYAPTVAAILARQRKLPYVTSTIGQLTDWSQSQKRFKKRIYNTLERYSLNRAAAIHCTTSAEAEDVEKFGVHTPKVVIPLGAEPPNLLSEASKQLRQKYNISENHSIILFLSRLHYKKRPDLLIEALSRLASQGQRGHLILAGGGDSSYCDYLRQQVKLAGIEEATTFVGFVSGFDKSLLLQGADLFVLPSFSENFGIAVVEAMAAGLPVIITSDIQLASTVFEAEAGLVISGELEQLQQALRELLSNSSERKRLGHNAKILANRLYHWPTITSQLALTYESILAKKPLPPTISFISKMS